MRKCIKKLKKVFFLNLPVIAFNIVIFSKGFLGFSITSGSIFTRALAITALLASLFLVIYGNYIIIFKKSSSNDEVEVVETSEYLKKIERCYTKCLKIKSRSGESIKLKFKEAIDQESLFKKRVASLDDIFNETFSPLARSEYSMIVVKFEDAFYKNIRKIASLSDFFYDLNSFENYESLEKNFDECVEKLETLVSINSQILDAISDLYININDVDAEDAEKIKYLSKKAMELLDVLKS